MLRIFTSARVLIDVLQNFLELSEFHLKCIVSVRLLLQLHDTCIFFFELWFCHSHHQELHPFVCFQCAAKFISVVCIILNYLFLHFKGGAELNI